ncbi:MAG TPA: hypothetical protein VM891_12760 [Amaricoccus sp.]|jgi:hypothetical protein|nr:hypothetical protein [Amaricoccus sp.]
MTVGKHPVSAVFHQPFRLPGGQETFPPGEYAVEVERPDERRAAVLIHLRRYPAGQGPVRTLTVPLADVQAALAGHRTAAPPLDDLLSDPMVRLFMASDGVTDDEVRGLCDPARSDR